MFAVETADEIAITIARVTARVRTSRAAERSDESVSFQTRGLFYIEPISGALIKRSRDFIYSYSCSGYHFTDSLDKSRCI